MKLPSLMFSLAAQTFLSVATLASGRVASALYGMALWASLAAIIYAIQDNKK